MSCYRWPAVMGGHRGDSATSVTMRALLSYHHMSRNSHFKHPFTVTLPHVTGRHRGKKAKWAGLVSGAVIIIGGVGAAAAFTAAGGPASAAALPPSCSASTSSSSAADATAALDARAADLSPAALRLRS